MFYSEAINYSVNGLKKILTNAEEEARINCLQNLSIEHKARLQAECQHDGRVFEKVPYTCYHVVYCLECGKKIREYDSSG